MRVTAHVARVLRVFLDDPAARRYGLELMKETGLPSGALYPILARLERAGWLRSEREVIDPAAAGRPPRRYYRLTASGLGSARTELQALTEQLRPRAEERALAPRVEGGSA